MTSSWKNILYKIIAKPKLQLLADSVVEIEPIWPWKMHFTALYPFSLCYADK